MSDTIAHGGVLLAVHQSIPAQQLTLRTPLQAVAARIYFNNRHISLCSIYLPPGVDFSLAELSTLFSEIPQPLIILGDFNAHHTCWGCERTDSRGRILESFMDEQSLCLLNNGTRTHFTLPTGRTSVLDLSFLSPQLMQCFSWSVLSDPMGSDHFPVWLECQCNVILGNRPLRWNMRRADWEAFQHQLELSLCGEDEAEGRDITIENITSVIINTAGSCIPRTSGKPRKPPVPWWTEACGDAIRARRRAFRAFDHRSTTENLIAFRRARAYARRVIQEAKRSSWRNYINSLNKNTHLSQVWSRIKRISGRYSSSPLPVLRVQGQTIMDPKDVANEIARALAERCRDSNTSEQFARHKNTSEKTRLSFDTRETLSYNQTFTMAELTSALGSLRTVAEGPDNVHNDMLKRLPMCAKEVLLRSFNEIWKRGIFPTAWREAIVVPILKPDKHGSDPLDYRPISLTSSLCKLMERMVNARLSWFLEVNNIFTNEQCGFRKYRSAVDHLLTIDTIARSTFTQGRCLGAVFFDIEKAYDTAWRHGILVKAYKYGIRGCLGHFLQNFLTDRFFRVRIGNELSERFPLINGVPQGSVLSVALFALMINDIGNTLPQCIGRSLFVDDFAIWCSSRNAISVQRQLQLAINRLNEWTNMNGFRFSVTKTTSMHFCCRRHCPAMVLRMNGISIYPSSEARFLGLILDSRLTYRPHLKLLRDRCFKALNILKYVSRTSYGADRKTLLLLYRSLVRSKMDYACFIYDSASDSVKRKLDAVHNSALRIVTGAFRTSPTASMLAEVNEPPLALRRKMLGIRFETATVSDTSLV